MAHRIRFEEGVQNDLVEACLWYDRQRSGLGDRLFSTVLDTFDRIAEMPMAYPKVDGETRRGLVRGFSYSVYFRLDGDDVWILAVMHNSRHPDRWRSRS